MYVNTLTIKVNIFKHVFGLLLNSLNERMPVRKILLIKEENVGFPPILTSISLFVSNKMMSMAFILYSVSYPYIHSKKHLIFAVRRSLQKCISDFSIYMEIDCSKSRWSRRRQKDNLVSDRRLFLHSFIRL